MKNILVNNNTRALLIAGGNIKPSTEMQSFAAVTTQSKEESRQKAIALRRMEMNKKPTVTNEGSK